MATLSEMIWQRGSAHAIMKEARKNFNRTSLIDPMDAHIAFASVHYSMIKRYREHWWQLPLAFWHLLQAVSFADYAIDGEESYGEGDPVTADQLDVLTTIWSKSPAWMNRRRYAELALGYALSSDHPEANSMKSHTRALMLIRLGEIEYGFGNLEGSRGRIRQAENLVHLIKNEPSDDREQQLVRVLFGIGAFYREHHSGKTEFLWAQDYIEQALDLADKVSKDQAAKIRAWRRKLGVTR